MIERLPAVDERVARPTVIAEQVVFLDGLTGTGKTMLAPILASFRRVEALRIEHIYEYVCALCYLGRLERDGASVLLRMYVDLACYNTVISREVNFRWRDLSGVLGQPRGWRYLARLLRPDGEAAMAAIRRERPILQILCHQVLGIARPLFEAIGHRMRMVEMVRHPLYLLEHWYSYIHRHGTDPRDFTVWIPFGGTHLPWFASGWEGRYIGASRMDRVIYTLDWLTRRADETLAALPPEAAARVLVVPFERFVTDPDSYLPALAFLLDTEPTPLTPKVLRRQRVPRRLTLQGRDLDVYRRYNWQPPERGSSEAVELRKRWDLAGREASAEAMDVLAQMVADYEQRYLRSEPGGPTA